MPPEDPDDSFVELADEEAKRHERRGFSDPRLRYVLLLVGIVVIVLVGGLLIRNWLRSSEVNGYKTYIGKVTDIVNQSDQVGKELTTLLTKPGTATRKDVQTKLDGYIQTANQLSQQAKDLAAPGPLKEAHQWFVATLQLRSKGLANLEPSLMNALEVQDLEVSSDQVTRAMQLLLLSDVAYQEFFQDQARQVLVDKKIAGVEVPTTSFLTDTTLASKATVQALLTTLKSSSSLQAIHGVALVSVVVMPGKTSIKAGGTYNLHSSDKLTFTVTVENQGNMTETDVLVSLRLWTASKTQPQIKTEKIPEIKPNQKQSITISGVTPTPYGEKASIRVETGPVPNEQNKSNNSLEAYVIFII
jgi:hypothetical protein